MGKLYNNGTPLSKVYSVSVNAPLDDRITVRYIADLTDGDTGIAAQVYKGMIVYVQEVNNFYIYTGQSSSTWKTGTDALVNGGDIDNWKKIDNFIDPSVNFEYYTERLGARVVNSVSELTNANLESPYAGMFAVVIDDNSDDSEDETGLYVLKTLPNTAASNWYKVLGGSGSGTVITGLDVTDVITFDGSAPAANSGFSISGNDENAFVEETYADENTKLEAGKYYTSRGLSSYDLNGGEELEVNYITLTNGGTSYIKLNSSSDNNWIELSITDNSLGFSAADVTYVDSLGEHQMTGTSLALPKGTLISFGDNDVDFTGMTESRQGDSETYIFGSTGSNYSDIDIYTPNILPTVYAYSDGTKVRVLTEGDKAEILNRITENTFEFNVQNHILRLVH